MKNSCLLLLFPPFWEPTHPYLSVPSLTAYIRSKGYNVIQKDLNIEFYDRLLTFDFWLELLKQKNIDNKPYLELIRNVNLVKTIFKTSDFYDVKKYLQARNILRNIFDLLSFIYKPTRIYLRYFSMRYKWQSSTEVIMATQDIKENPFIDYYNNYVINEILSYSPSIIGVSIMEASQVIPGLTLIRLIKSIKPEIHITVGGDFFSKVYKNIYPHLFKIFFDSVIIKEGEVPLLNLVQILTKQQEYTLDNVPSLIYIKNNEVKFNPISTSCDINQLPTPDFDGFPLDKYLVPNLILPIITSRNCYWKKCAFCDHYYSFSSKYRTRKIEKVIEDLQILKQKYNVQNFVFNDESITANRCKQIALKIKEKRLNIYWLALSRFEKGFTLETCKKISSGGGKFLIFGLESINSRVLKLINKGFTPDIVLKVLRNTSKAGIWTKSYTFFGFPTETKKEALNTLKFIIKNKDIIPCFSIGVFALKKYSPIPANPDKYNINIIPPDFLNDWDLNVKYITKSGMTYEQAENLCKKVLKVIWKKYNAPFWLIENLRSVILLYLTYYGIDKLRYLET